MVVLNGKKTVDADLDWLQKDPAVAREHTGLARTTGKLGLQSHSERVEFRNLRIKELKDSSNRARRRFPRRRLINLTPHAGAAAGLALGPGRKADSSKLYFGSYSRPDRDCGHDGQSGHDRGSAPGPSLDLFASSAITSMVAT